MHKGSKIAGVKVASGLACPRSRPCSKPIYRPGIPQLARSLLMQVPCQLSACATILPNRAILLGLEVAHQRPNVPTCGRSHTEPRTSDHGAQGQPWPFIEPSVSFRYVWGIAGKKRAEPTQQSRPGPSEPRALKRYPVTCSALLRSGLLLCGHSTLAISMQGRCQ